MIIINVVIIIAIAIAIFTIIVIDYHYQHHYHDHYHQYQYYFHTKSRGLTYHEQHVWLFLAWACSAVQEPRFWPFILQKSRHHDHHHHYKYHRYYYQYQNHYQYYHYYHHHQVRCNLIIPWAPHLTLPHAFHQSWFPVPIRHPAEIIYHFLNNLC